jgi:TPR repeat protein
MYVFLKKHRISLVLNLIAIKNQEMAFHYFKLAANQGDNEAQISVGNYFKKGLNR